MDEMKSVYSGFRTGDFEYSGLLLEFKVLITIFCIYLRTNIELCPLLNKLIGFYCRKLKCLQRVRTGDLNRAVCG